MKKTSLALFALATIVLTACTATTDLPSQFSLSPENQDMGLAIASLTLSGISPSRIASLEFQIEPKHPHSGNDTVVEKLRLSSATQQTQAAARRQNDRSANTLLVVAKDENTRLPMEINEQTIQGRLAALRLSPGDYELNGWRVRKSSADGITEMSPEHSFSFPFTIRPGETTYLGQINLDIQNHGTSIMVTDQRQRDLKLLAEKYPLIRIKSFQVASGPSGTSAP